MGRRGYATAEALGPQGCHERAVKAITARWAKTQKPPVPCPRCGDPCPTVRASYKHCPTGITKPRHSPEEIAYIAELDAWRRRNHNRTYQTREPPPTPPAGSKPYRRAFLGTRWIDRTREFLEQAEPEPPPAPEPKPEPESLEELIAKYSL